MIDSCLECWGENDEHPHPDPPTARRAGSDLDAVRERFPSGYAVAEEPFEATAVMYDLVAEVEQLRAEIERLRLQIRTH